VADFYERLQGTASRLMDKFKQGVITYTHPGAPSGPAYAPITGTPVTYSLDATSNGVGQQYRGSTLVIETDKEVTAAVFGVKPTVEGTLTIDGVTHQIVLVRQVPAAGVPVAWKMVARA